MAVGTKSGLGVSQVYSGFAVEIFQISDLLGLMAGAADLRQASSDIQPRPVGLFIMGNMAIPAGWGRIFFQIRGGWRRFFFFLQGPGMGTLQVLFIRGPVAGLAAVVIVFPGSLQLQELGILRIRMRFVQHFHGPVAGFTILGAMG